MRAGAYCNMTFGKIKLGALAAVRGMLAVSARHLNLETGLDLPTTNRLRRFSAFWAIAQSAVTSNPDEFFHILRPPLDQRPI